MSLAISCRLLGTKLFGTKVSNAPMLGVYLTRNASTVEDYKIKWVRPKSYPEFHPRQSGDLGLDLKIDPDELILNYDKSKEMEDANELVRRMFSVKLSRKRETRLLQREKATSLVRRHVLDYGSPEVKIADMTTRILDIQEYMKKHPHNKRAKVCLLEMIGKRRKYLGYLRKWDYGRYEWVLERMNLVFKAVPEKLGIVSRKESITKMTETYCDQIIKTKVDAFKAELEGQLKNFYTEKAEKLAFIRKEEIECGLEPTVTEEDIEEARKKAETYNEPTEPLKTLSQKN